MNDEANTDMKSAMPTEATLDQPIDQETRDHEQITPPPGPQGFAAPDSVEERRNELFAQLTEICPGIDSTAANIMSSIDLLARRIAVDMLGADEFFKAMHTYSMAIMAHVLVSGDVKANRDEVPDAQELQDSIYNRIEFHTKQTFIDMLASKEFADRILIAQKAFIFELVETQLFKSAVGEITSNMIGQSVPALLASDEMVERLHKANTIFFDGPELHARVMDIAWPKIHPGDDRAETVYTLCKAMQEKWLESAEFKGRIMEITNDWYYNERGQTRPDAERSQGHLCPGSSSAPIDNDPTDVHKRQPPDCDHVWVAANVGIETGMICRLCGLVRATELADVPEQCLHKWMPAKDEAASGKQVCAKCHAIRTTPDPADVPEEIVEIDEAGNVTAVESTVHTKPIEPPQDLDSAVADAARKLASGP